MRKKCSNCGHVNSYCSSPTESVGWFLSDMDVDGLPLAGPEFKTRIDFQKWLNEIAEPMVKCNKCGMYEALNNE